MNALSSSAQHFIGGTLVPSSSDELVELRSPADDQVIGWIPSGTADDADRAVGAARAALPDWKARSVAARAALVGEVLDELGRHADALAAEQEREMGQPHALALATLQDYVASLKARIDDVPVPFAASLESGRVLRQPRGVGALVVPWNFPIPVALQGLVALLVTGNTVVWKPSERSPLSAVLAMSCIREIVPPGVVNLLLGDARAGNPLVAHPGVDVVVFTGSVRTGRHVARVAGERFAKVVLELGGKDPAIVDAGVDPRWAAQQVADGAFRNAGQLCTSIERVYVHAQVAEPFLDALAETAARCEIGPLVDRGHRTWVHEHVRAAIADGARLLTGGELPPGSGSYYPPTVLTDVPQESRLMREETFGPVAPIHIVQSFEEAVALANDSEFGLGASVFSVDPAHLELAVRELRSGWLWLNEWGAASAGAEAEPQRGSGLGGSGSLLLHELQTTRYVHDGAGSRAGEPARV